MSKPNKRRQAKQKARSESLRKRKTAPSVRKAPAEDPFLSERLFRRISLLQEGKPAGSADELESVMEHILAETPSVDAIALDKVKADPAEMAQEIAFQALAWANEGDLDHAYRLAKKALDLDPENPDANALLVDPGAYQILDPETLESLLELRGLVRKRLETRFGAPLPGTATEAMLRPYHRLLALLLHQAPLVRKHELAFELSREIAALGANVAMDVPATVSWLLAGRHRAEADALLDFLETPEDAAAPQTDSDPHLRWWRSWSAFQAGDTVRAQRLAELANGDFPDSGLFLFAYTAEERERVDASPHFDEFTENFLPLVDPIQLDEPYGTAVRGWLGLDS